MKLTIPTSYVLVGAMLFFAGCSGGKEGQKPVYPVKGTVKMGGGPLVGATVTFAPKASGQPAAFGQTNASGEYELSTYGTADGAAAGEFSVTVMKVLAGAPAAAGAGDGHGSSAPGTGHSGGSGKKAQNTSSNLVPPQYGDAMKTPLSYTVKADGENRYDIEIK